MYVITVGCCIVGYRFSENWDKTAGLYQRLKVTRRHILQYGVIPYHNPEKPKSHNIKIIINPEI